MCFEFEWLYWAQLAQEKTRQQESAGKRHVRPAEDTARTARQSHPDEPDRRREPVHA